MDMLCTHGEKRTENKRKLISHYSADDEYQIYSYYSGDERLSLVFVCTRESVPSYSLFFFFIILSFIINRKPSEINYTSTK